MLPEALLLHWRVVLKCLSSTYLNCNDGKLTQNNLPNLRAGKCLQVYFCVFCICSGMIENCLILFKALHYGIQNCSVVFSVLKATHCTQCLKVCFLKYIKQIFEYWLGISGFYYFEKIFWQHLRNLISMIKFGSGISQENLKYLPIPYHCLLRSPAYPQSGRTNSGTSLAIKNTSFEMCWQIVTDWYNWII